MSQNCSQPFSERFCVGSKCFFAVLLGAAQEITLRSRRKRPAEGAVFSYEDAAKGSFFSIYLQPVENFGRIDKKAGRFNIVYRPVDNLQNRKVCAIIYNELLCDSMRIFEIKNIPDPIERSRACILLPMCGQRF